MAILLTHEAPPFKGGVSVYCHEVALAAKKLGLPFVVWSPSYLLQKEIVPYPIFRLQGGESLHPLSILRFAKSIAAHEKELENQSVIVGSYGAHLAVMLLLHEGNLKKCRLFSLLHGSEIPRFSRNKLWRMFSRKFFDQVEHVFVNSEFTKSLFLCAALTKKSDHITVAKCAFNSVVGKNVTAEDHSDFRVLTLARIHPRKGQLESAMALARLPDEVKKKVVYYIGGTGCSKYLKKILDFCEENQLRYEYLGSISDENLAQVYANCDVFLMTSRSLPLSVEGFGMSYLEAAWHGKPVVAFRSGGVNEAVLDGETGFLAEEGNLDDVTEAILQLFQNAELGKKMGENAVRFSKIFSWEQTIRTIFNSIA